MAREIILQLESLARTRTVGMALAEALSMALETTQGGGQPARPVCLFFGEMGAGKTTLIKAICEGLGIDPGNVISPTYTLVNIYPGRVSVYHVDLFRMEEPDALLELDRDDWLNPSGLTLIEWPELALPLLNGENLLELHLSAPMGKPELRELRIPFPEMEMVALFNALEPMAG